MYRIHAPNREYDGKVAGVEFHAGDSDVIESVPDYFRRHPYEVEELHEETDGEKPPRRTRRKPA